jgi:hypothetical protein
MSRHPLRNDGGGRRGGVGSAVEPHDWFLNLRHKIGNLALLVLASAQRT